MLFGDFTSLHLAVEEGIDPLCSILDDIKAALADSTVERSPGPAWPGRPRPPGPMGPPAGALVYTRPPG